MSWTGLSSTQWVSYSNLQDAITYGYLPANTTAITTSDRWVRKDQVSTYVINDTSNGYYAGKSSSQWLAKRDITSNISSTYTYDLYYTLYSHGDFEGWSNGANACAYSGYTALTIYSTNSSLSVGTILYSNASGGGFNFATISGTLPYFYMPSISSYVTLTWAGNGYPFVVASITACTTTYSLTMDAEITASQSGAYLWYNVGGAGWIQIATALYGSVQTLSPIYGISYGTTVMLVIADYQGPVVAGSWIPTNIATGGMPAYTTNCTILGLTIYADTVGYAIGYSPYGLYLC